MSEEIPKPSGRVTENNTIAEGKSYLRQNWTKGVPCPCCKQFVKLYPRKLTSAMAYALILIYRHHQTEGSFGAFFHVENHFKLLDIPSSIRGDFPKLRYWGLIEQQIINNAVIPAYYRITALGIQFVKEVASVSKISLLYNNTFYGFEGPEITIKDALKDKFNYSELMGYSKITI
jgi:hypothetical protein